MFEKRFYVEGLAHASYLIGAGGEAAVIDPKRDVDDYLETATQENLRIVAVLETHPHADFVSGHVELASRTGAKIYVSHLAPAQYERVAARDGDIIRVGPLDNVDRCSQRNGYRHRAALSDIAPRFQPKRVTEQCSQPPIAEP